MEIEEIRNGDETTLRIAGRLDTRTAPELDAWFRDDGDRTRRLVLDLSGLEYISSAGLRVVLALHKQMSKRGGLKVSGVADPVMEVLEATGFIDILEIG